MHRSLLACITVAGLALPAVAHAQQQPAVPPPPPPSAQGQAGATVDAQVQIGQPVTTGPTVITPGVQATTTAPVAQPMQQPVAVAPPPPYYYMPMRPVPYNGGPVPPGMHVEARPMTGLVVAGAAIFGGFYLPTAIIGLMLVGASGSSAWLAVPIAGPLIWAGVVNGSTGGGGLGSEAWSLGAVLSIGQLAGAAMFIAGLAVRRDWLVPGPGPNTSRRANQRSIAWQFSPSAPGATVGVSLAATHF